MKRATVNFNAIEFQRLHGHMPRGRALWVFYFSDDPDSPWIPGQRQNEMRPRSYYGAKVLATNEARRRGVSSVRVDPLPL